MERTPTPDIRSAAELSFSQFLHHLEVDKAKLTTDLENSAKKNASLSQEIVELKNQNAKYRDELNLAKKWCFICGKETKKAVQQHAICSENCLKKLWEKQTGQIVI